jgi:hypothetical protein
MIDDLVQIALGLSVAVGCVSFYCFGAAHGREKERERVCVLLREAINYRFSGSIRWVWNAVESGSKRLMDPDRFFGPDRPSDRPPVH